ncbi:hypothetical protein PIB30_074450 [Stylosanthes scabra]|uniref:Uncharacterized protein n=1 Tax=Stylosanthes scabra TaxID=79078 RepID=A0ABU6QQ77_9FABA|nr:hypothetical protein [Stylosanthes scabra]
MVLAEERGTKAASMAFLEQGPNFETVKKMAVRVVARWVRVVVRIVMVDRVVASADGEGEREGKNAVARVGLAEVDGGVHGVRWLMVLGDSVAVVLCDEDDDCVFDRRERDGGYGVRLVVEGGGGFEWCWWFGVKGKKLMIDGGGGFAVVREKEIRRGTAHEDRVVYTTIVVYTSGREGKT